jgi:hypothetical protein
MQAPYTLAANAKVHVFDARDLPWQETPEPGLRLKPVRYDDERGHFFGLVAFDAMARSGLHQHQGVATSFVLDGGLSDYIGSIGLHQAGINLAGATHDAMAYQNTLLVSRLEGPVIYPKERAELTGLHAGSRHADVHNPAPEAPPEINVDVDALPRWQSGIAGLLRQTIFDYAGTGSGHRFLQLRLAPGVVCPAWRSSALTEFWVRGGLVQIDGRLVQANSFVVIEAGALVEMASPHGALLLAWAQGPEVWRDPAALPRQHSARCSLFGF